METQDQAVLLMRKISYAKGSDSQAEAQAVLMSAIRTLKLRGVNPTDAIEAGFTTVSGIRRTSDIEVDIDCQWLKVIASPPT
jgi:hypothetical protein